MQQFSNVQTHQQPAAAIVVSKTLNIVSRGWLPYCALQTIYLQLSWIYFCAPGNAVLLSTHTSAFQQTGFNIMYLQQRTTLYHIFLYWLNTKHDLGQMSDRKYVQCNTVIANDQNVFWVKAISDVGNPKISFCLDFQDFWRTKAPLSH